MPAILPHEKYAKLAKRKEANFEWDEAADIYESAIPDLMKNGKHLEAGETQERSAYSRYRAAYQSGTKEEFKTLLEATSRSYGRAAEIYETLEGPNGEARVLVNRVMEHFYRSWLIEDPSDRKTQVSCCVQEFKDALQVCEDVEDNTRYGIVCNDFLAILYAQSELLFNYTEGLETIEIALDYGSKALEALKKGDEGYELARCYYLLSLFLPDRPMGVVKSVEKQRELLQLGMGYAETAVKLSKKIEDPYLIGMSCGILSLYYLEVNGDTEKAISLARRQLEIGEFTRDRLVLARANEYLTYYLGSWIAVDEEDRDKIKTAATDGIHYANEAISYYKTILNPILTAFLGHNRGHTSLGRLETDLELKQQYETEGLEATHSDLEYATESGSQLGQMYTYLILGSSYLNLAKLERDEHKKNELLSESMRYNQQYIDSARQAQPFRYWNISVAYNKLIDARGQLAKSEDDRDRQTELLLEAIADMEKSLELYNTHISVHDIIGYRANYAVAQIMFSEILFQMHLVSDDDQYLDKAIQVFDDAIETYKISNMPSNIAEILWKKAWAYYQKLEFSKSATEFDGASMYYIQAGEKYPNHKAFYVDYGNYMGAWGNIARAMDYHSTDEYFLEKEFFEKAVQTLLSSENWNYLSPNYLAWARLAEAENHSRNEQCEKAIELFQESSTLFSSAKKSIKDKIDSIGVRDEAEMAAELISASSLRRDYCFGRAAIEEAKILDRKGEHTASSERYGRAIKTFQKIVDAMEDEPERREIRPLISLCRAWEKMTQAEAEASPDKYMEASLFFEEAKDNSFNEKTMLLAMGHASFCRALEAGTRYEITKAKYLHQELIRNLNSASNFYVKAGFESALDYSKATQRLFEAYLYMDKARDEDDPERKVRFYVMAERVLETAADSFMKANHPEKGEEALRFIESIREDRELASSLSRVLHAPSISSSTMSFEAPTPSHESPVGLERFEHADIQANFELSTERMTLDDEMELRMNFVNTGNSAAALISIEDVVPAGFEILEKPENIRVEASSLDLRGRRLSPLKTEEMKLLLNPLAEGTFTIRPRIQYLDDTGTYKTFMAEPISVEVNAPKDLVKGKCYLYESQERGLKTFARLINRGEAGVLISRGDPELLMVEYGFSVDEAFVLSSRGLKGFKALPDLQIVSRTISRCLSGGVDVVFLGGLEYLVSRFGFDSVLNFLQEKRFNILEVGAVMLVPFNLETVSAREGALLKSELEIID